MRGFGAARLFLLVSFVILSCTLYFYVDSHTLQRWLQQVSVLFSAVKQGLSACLSEASQHKIPAHACSVHTSVCTWSCLQIQGNPYGYLHSFLVAYTMSVIFLFPCMIVQVISGALYGFWMGLLISWFATSVGQSVAFLIGRYLFRPTVKSYLHSTWPSFPAIDAAIKKEGWRLVCLLRLSPVLPYNVLNYALAITPVSFWVFSIASAVATIPWTALYVYLGTFSTDLVELSRVSDEFHVVTLLGIFMRRHPVHPASAYTHDSSFNFWPLLKSIEFVYRCRKQVHTCILHTLLQRELPLSY